MGRIASFHLVREHSALRAMVHLATDRRILGRTDGLVFWRLLGTGRGAATTRSADFHRTALFAVWRDERDLEAFMADSAVARRWARGAEQWHVRLRAVGGHGRWRGVDVLAGIDRGDDRGAIAVVTRADVRWRAWSRFWRAGRTVDRDVQRARGLLAVVAMGELPVGRLGTFSVWRGVDDVTAFATHANHLDVVRRTRSESWYREDLFARFQPYASSGSWEGRDPLGG
jgi:hypothetical protein